MVFVLFGEFYVILIIVDFLWDFFEVNVYGYMNDNVVDLIDMNIDVVICISKFKDFGLYVIFVGYV